MRSGEQMDGNQVYLTMNGPTEFDVIGRLREWDRTADLGRIDVPTLVTCGRYDEITPACSETITAGIPDARMHVFERSAHSPTSRRARSTRHSSRTFLSA